MVEKRSWNENLKLLQKMPDFFSCTVTHFGTKRKVLLVNLYVQYQFAILDVILLVFWQISLVETPERGRKKLMSLTTNVMRDDSDKVKDYAFLYFS